MVNEFGKELRKMRIEKNEILKQMAEKLQMSSAYLSAIEVGKRPIPDDLVGKISKLYGLTAKEERELQKIADKNKKTIKIVLDEYTKDQASLMLKFARSFKTLDKNKLDQISEVLKGEKGEK